MRHVRGHHDYVTSAAVSRDRNYVVSGSANGTLVNGTRITEATYLDTGTVLTVGSATFRAECDDDASHADDVEVLTAEVDGDASRIESESGVVSYAESAEGSFVGIEEAVEVVDDVADVNDRLLTGNGEFF